MLGLQQLIETCDLLVEATSAAATPDIVRSCLAAGKAVVPLSVGGFSLDPALLRDVEAARAAVHVPSGAIAGLDGIRRGLTPPDSTDANIFELTEDEREERGILSLPSNLSEAVRAMKRDPLIRETLGEHIFQKYVTHKKEEWDEYKIRVTQWELDRYLERY